MAPAAATPTEPAPGRNTGLVETIMTGPGRMGVSVSRAPAQDAAPVRAATPVTRTADETLRPYLDLETAVGTFNITGLPWDEASQLMQLRLPTIRGWFAYLREHPRYVPSTISLAAPFGREKLLTELGGQPDRKEEVEGAMWYRDGRSRLVWFQYEDVGFAVDPEDKVVAIRITALPAGAAGPTETGAPSPP